jgi:hypothetical protein
MDQQNPEVAPSLDLPKPQVDTSSTYSERVPNETVPDTEVSATQAVERGFSSPAGFAPPGIQPQHDPVTQQQDPPSIDPASTMSTTASAGIPAIADDVDLIEKEWVAKAKEIVAETKDDPYSQNKEMTKVKAEYIKKRYNKVIKLSEE